MAEMQRKKFEEMSGFKEMQSFENQLSNEQKSSKTSKKINLTAMMITLLSKLNDAGRIFYAILEETIFPICTYIAMILIVIDLVFYSANIPNTLLRLLTLVVLISYVKGGIFFGGGKRR